MASTWCGASSTGPAQFLNPGGALMCEVGRGRAAVEAAYPELPLLWLDTETSEGEVFWAAGRGLSAPRADTASRDACGWPLLAPLALGAAAACADDDPEMRARPLPERDLRPSGCVARVIAQHAPPPRASRTDAARRRAERLGAAVYARCGLPR